MQNSRVRLFYSFPTLTLPFSPIAPVPLVWGNTSITPFTGSILQGFTMNPDGATLRCTTPGYYQVSYGVACSLPPGNTLNVDLCFNYVITSYKPATHRSTISNPSSIAMTTQVTAPSFYIGAVVGDTISMRLQSSGGTGPATILGITPGVATTTGLVNFLHGTSLSLEPIVPDAPVSPF